jgi:hypothetical protein
MQCWVPINGCMHQKSPCRAALVRHAIAGQSFSICSPLHAAQHGTWATAKQQRYVPCRYRRTADTCMSCPPAVQEHSRIEVNFSSIQDMTAVCFCTQQTTERMRVTADPARHFSG